jgi:hypothetical protein
MADRTDIDALLISALYGELTPADEARLTAHLESHPADRSALAELTQTRATVRDSRILAVQLEPPQSISAMLLREAARRAPREREDAGWFHRFVRSFMAHPAMAAAAMLVLVVGVAGTLYVRHGDPFVGPALSERAEVSTAQTAAAPPAAAPTGAAEPPSPADPAVAAAPGDDLARRDSNAGSASFGVGLADERAAQRDIAALKQQRAQGEAQYDAQDGKAKKEIAGGLAEPKLAKPAVVATKPSKKGSGGIEVRSRALAPKDLDEGTNSVGRAGAGRADVDDGAIASGAKSDRPPGNAGPAGGGATPAPATTPLSQNQAPPQAAYDRAPAAAAPVPAPTTTAQSKAPAPSKTVARTAGTLTKNAPPPPPPAPAATADAASEAERKERRSVDKAPLSARAEEKAEEKAEATPGATPAQKAAAAKLVSWAAQQHRQVVALVNSDKCDEAANAAIAIYNRAPDYYAASVATDRSIKPCLSYVTREREREDRSRAIKRANAVDAPAAAPPKRK